MPSIKAIKQRRASVQNMQQAMRAMNLVATAKLQRARVEWQQVRAFVEGTDDIALSAAQDERVQDHFYVQERGPGRNAVYLIISSDRGKCGGYNINVAKKAANHAVENGKNAKFIVVGLKGLEYFVTRGQVAQYIDASKSRPTFTRAQELCRMLLDAYGTEEVQGEADEVYIVYTKFTSILATEPTVVQILPLNARFNAESARIPNWKVREGLATTPQSGVKKNTGTHAHMAFDPGPKDFISHMVPRYVNAYIYGAMMESMVCEHAARMLNMDAATNNAQEIIEDLTLMFNRQRQGAITQEITEIVSGANALA